MIRASCFRSALLVAGFLLSMVAPSHATDKTDLMVGLKVLPVLQNKISGDVSFAVVYDPSNPDSKSDADAIKGIVDAGLEVPGGAKLVASVVAVNEMGKIGSAKIAFLTRGIPVAAFDSIYSASTSNGVLTISTDLDCVKANKCILGVVSKPSVEIYYSKAASDAAKIGFVPAFTMLAKQI